MNLTDLALDTGVSVPTAKRWISILETGYQVFLLPPYYGSIGALFETLVVTDVLKRFLHAGQMPSMYYVRTRDGLEVDMALEIGQKLILIEIKSAMTVYSKHAASPVRLKEDLGDRVKAAYLLSAARGSFPSSRGISNLNWLDALAT